MKSILLIFKKHINKIYLSLFLFSIALAIYFLFNLYNEAKASYFNQYQKQEKILVDQTSLALKSYLEERIRALEVLADYPASKKNETEIFLTEYKRTYEKVGGFTSIAFVDTLGNIKNGYPDLEVSYRNILTDIYHYGDLQREWKSALNYEHGIVSRISICRDSLKIIYLLAPIYQEDKFKGLILGEIHSNQMLQEQIKPILKDFEGYIWILQEDGKIIYHSVHDVIPFADITKPTEDCFECHKNFDLEKILLNESSGNLIGTGRNSDQLTSFTSLELPNTNWKVAISIPRAIIEDLLKDTSRSLTLIGFMLFIILISFTIFLFIQINNRTKLERELRAHAEKSRLERKYINLVENLPEGVFTYSDDEIIFSNYSLMEIFGTDNFSPEYDIIDEESKIIFSNSLNNIITSVDTRLTFDLNCETSNNQKLNLVVVLFIIEGDKKGTVHGIVRDITSYKRLEHEKFKKENLAQLGEMGARIAHEIKNPLASIQTGIQLLKGKFKDDLKEKDFCDRIINEIVRMDNTVKTILNFSKDYFINRQKYSIIKPLTQVLELSDNTIREKQITIVKNYDNHVPELNIDHELWKQIFWNLLNNSIQELKHGGKIFISIFMRNKKVVIDFGDSGNKIPAKIKEKVFNPFFSTRAQGTGLGLAIVKRFVEMHDGSIKVISEKKTETKFRIEIPVE